MDIIPVHIDVNLKWRLCFMAYRRNDTMHDAVDMPYSDCDQWGLIYQHMAKFPEMYSNPNNPVVNVEIREIVKGI